MESDAHYAAGTYLSAKIENEQVTLQIYFNGEPGNWISYDRNQFDTLLAGLTKLRGKFRR